jgi:hypothetical protein
MERHDIKPDWTVHNGGFGAKPEATEPEATEEEKPKGKKKESEEDGA